MQKNLLNRVLDLDLPEGQSLFLWGVRKTGKSTYLKQRFPNSLYIDLLQSGEFLAYSARPSLLREQILAETPSSPVIIDEIQKIPALLDEIHGLIESYPGISFILCGSSMRRIKHQGANLLGGRAWRQNFLPLCFPELPSLDLLKIFNRGLIPDHFLSLRDSARTLRSYVSEYLVQEVQWESRIRNFGAFSRFLEAIAFSNAEMLNCANVARECAIDAKTVRAYIDLLEEMMLAYTILPYTKTLSRSIISHTPKFYFFDPALPHAIAGRTISSLRGPEAGHSLEHYIFLELHAYRELRRKTYKINYWRTKTGLEVDFILDRGRVAIEVKLSENVQQRDLRGLASFSEEHKPQKSIVVSLESRPRVVTIGDSLIHIYPVYAFLKLLWEGGIL